MEPVKDNERPERAIVTMENFSIYYIPKFGTNHCLSIEVDKRPPILLEDVNLMALLIKIETIIINDKLLSNPKKALKDAFSETEKVIQAILKSFAAFLGDDMLGPPPGPKPQEPKSRLILY